MSKADHEHIWGADRVMMLPLSGEAYHSDQIYCIECSKKPNGTMQRKIRNKGNYPCDVRFFVVDRYEKLRAFGRYVNESKFISTQQQRLSKENK